MVLSILVWFVVNIFIFVCISVTTFAYVQNQCTLFIINRLCFDNYSVWQKTDSRNQYLQIDYYSCHSIISPWKKGTNIRQYRDILWIKGNHILVTVWINLYFLHSFYSRLIWTLIALFVEHFNLNKTWLRLWIQLVQK